MAHPGEELFDGSIRPVKVESSKSGFAVGMDRNRAPWICSTRHRECASLKQRALLVNHKCRHADRGKDLPHIQVNEGSDIRSSLARAVGRTRRPGKPSPQVGICGHVGEGNCDQVLSTPQLLKLAWRLPFDYRTAPMRSPPLDSCEVADPARNGYGQARDVGTTQLNIARVDAGP